MVTAAVSPCRTTSSSIWRALPTTASVRMQTSSSLYTTLARPNRSGMQRNLGVWSCKTRTERHTHARTCSHTVFLQYIDWSILYMTITVRWPLLQWEVHGEAEQKWRTKESRESGSSVCSLHCKKVPCQYILTIYLYKTSSRSSTSFMSFLFRTWAVKTWRETCTSLRMS